MSLNPMLFKGQLYYSHIVSIASLTEVYFKCSCFLKLIVLLFNFKQKSAFPPQMEKMYIPTKESLNKNLKSIKMITAKLLKHS